MTSTPFPTDLPVGSGNLIGLTMAPNSAVDEQMNASSNVDLFGDALADGTSEDSLDTPVVSSITASSTSTAGGETIVISGNHLTDSTNVRFGSTSA